MGILSALQSDPKGTLIILLYQIPAILIALTLHELSHGYVAYRCGDPTAQMMGRLTFNPLKHLDPIGTLFMLLFGFGWARPVPVNPRNYKHFRRDDLLVSLAGITMNFCLFLMAMLLMTSINQLLWKPELWTLGSLATPREFLSFQGMNFYSVLGSENTIVVEDATQYIRSVSGNSAYLSLLTPSQFQNMSIVYDSTGAYYFALEGLSDYLRSPWLIYVQRFLMFFARINLSLAIFNLIPIPPLDGYHVVNDIFLRGRLHIPAKVMNVVMIGMLALFYFTDIFSTAISTAVYFVQGGVLNAILWVFGLG
ncbi:MAG: site-2 protease family protein [Clostridia bacterium]|nr:site-2 protease family protein [Clostridia bacterium]